MTAIDPSDIFRNSARQTEELVQALTDFYARMHGEEKCKFGFDEKGSLFFQRHNSSGIYKYYPALDMIPNETRQQVVVNAALRLLDSVKLSTIGSFKTATFPEFDTDGKRTDRLVRRVLHFSGIAIDDYNIGNLPNPSVNPHYKKAECSYLYGEKAYTALENALSTARWVVESSKPMRYGPKQAYP